jgi:exodeoxyribonuclease V alpha subunit
LLAGFLTPGELNISSQEFLSDYEAFHAMKLSEAQKEAVEKLVTNRVLVLTGLPGTGKTTIVRAFVELFQKAGLSFALMAPTGIAAKKLSSVTGQQAFTVHRALRYNGEVWGYNSQCKYSVGAVILDEASMVDQELFFRVLDALDPGTMLVIVGDDAQLPSVGPGSVLRELIQCPDIPTVRLTQIFRQSQESSIVTNSHRVNRGEVIEVGSAESDFRFISVSEEAKIADLVVSMASKLKSKDANFQVLSPKYEGIVGVDNLNSRLQEVLNPPSSTSKEFSRGNLRFRVGDRLMVIKNDYQLGVFNGDLGKLHRITRDCLEVVIYGGGEDLDKIVSFPVGDVLIKLRLAYVVTVHRSQGSEFDTVILPVVKSQGRMLQRNLFYTAITRAKKKVWVLGDFSAVQKAIDNDKVVLRNTGFGQAIHDSIGV